MRIMRHIFSEDRSEAAEYGFENVQVQYYAVENSEKWLPKLRIVNGVLNPQTEEQDLLVIDDAWLKLAQLMHIRYRKQGRAQRQPFFANKQGAEWASQALQDAKKRKLVFCRAGEIVCLLSALGEDVVMYFRDGEAPTIMDLLDPVQIFIPAPVLSNMPRAKVVEDLQDNKPRTVTILAEALESSLDTMKSFE